MLYENHYINIKRIDLFFNPDTRHKKFFCRSCSNLFYSEIKYNDHIKFCQTNKPMILLPSKYKYLEFKKDISSFFKNIDIIHYGEFNILIDLIDEIFVSSRDGVTYDIKPANLIVEEIKLSEEDEIRYLKKLDNGYIKTINFLENHVKIFNDKFNINRHDFYLNNVRNGGPVYIYGILYANKTGSNYDMPSVKFNEPRLLIDSVRFENPILNDISAYKSLKSKSMYSNNFIINYDDYINYYRIYFWNISRQIKDDNANKFINILSGMEASASEVYIVFKTSASITMKYSKNDKLIVYKSQ